MKPCDWLVSQYPPLYTTSDSQPTERRVTRHDYRLPWRRETNSSTRVIRRRNATISDDRVSRLRRSQRHRSLTAAASCLLAHACINEGRFVLLVTTFMALNNSHRHSSRRSSSREETRENAVSRTTSSTELIQLRQYKHLPHGVNVRHTVNNDYNHDTESLYMNHSRTPETSELLTCSYYTCTVKNTGATRVTQLSTKVPQR